MGHVSSIFHSKLLVYQSVTIKYSAFLQLIIWETIDSEAVSWQNQFW